MKYLLALFLALPFAVGAEPIKVRTASHNEFTRLVLDTPSDRVWRMELSGDRSVIRLPGHQDGFDTSDVFRRIGRDRIQDIVSNQDRLFLSLGCECSVAVFPNGRVTLLTGSEASETVGV